MERKWSYCKLPLKYLTLAKPTKHDKYEQISKVPPRASEGVYVSKGP